MKKPKVFETASIKLSDLVAARHRCAWSGCTQTTAMPLDRQGGWRWMLVGRNTLGGIDDLLDADRDCVLCPQHWAELDGLLEDIGKQLDKTEGSG